MRARARGPRATPHGHNAGKARYVDRRLWRAVATTRGSIRVRGHPMQDFYTWTYDSP